jgi:hypothetical protein
VSAAVLQIHQFNRIVFYKQRELFCQRHRFGKIADNSLYIGLFRFGAHARLLEKDKVCGNGKGSPQKIIQRYMQIIKTGLKHNVKIYFIVFNFNL